MSAQERRPSNLLDQRLESSLDNVDVSEEKAVSLALEAGFEEEDAYRLGYAVREAMVNAIVHGNRYSANKYVHFQVNRVERGLEVIIQDEGAGFVAADQADPLARENLLNQSGRGLALVRAFTDALTVEAVQPAGTRVILRKFLPPAAG
jgi:serine/threonine-protein kinase RsbW